MDHKNELKSKNHLIGKYSVFKEVSPPIQETLKNVFDKVSSALDELTPQVCD